MHDLSARTDRLDDYLDRRGLRAAWFATKAGATWLLGVEPGRDEAGGCVATAGYVRGEGVRVVVDAAEADRFAASVPDEVGIERVEWYESSPLDVVARRSPTPAAADVSVPGFEALDAAALRTPLFESEVPAFRRLGRETAASVERVCREARPTDTEREVAAGVRIGLASTGADVVDLRVGNAARAAEFPRPRPTAADLTGGVVVTVTAERDGRHVSLSRTVTFEGDDGVGVEGDEDDGRQRDDESGRAAGVNPGGSGDGSGGADDERTRARSETLEDGGRAAAHETARSVVSAGVRAAAEREHAGAVFAAMREAYAAGGHPEAWRRAPPGGAIGYAPREWVTRPDGEERTERPLAFAATPWVAGSRCGDTYLVGAAGDVDRLTASGEWPTEEREGVAVARRLPR